jgi:acetyl esterase
MDRTTTIAHLAGIAARGVLHLPAPVQRMLAEPAPEGATDLVAEARLLARVATLAEPAPPADPRHVATPAARRAFAAQAAAVGGRPPFAGRIEERVVPGAAGPLAARLYVPRNVGEPAPLLVFLHGGGWVRGDLDSHDAPCRVLAGLAGVRVLSVEYRKAPEHPFPAPADDALAAWAHVAGHADELGADPARLAIGGDSAGGNLAAVTAIGARDGRHPSPAFQLLIYPACDLSRKHPSVALFSKGFLLSEADTDRYKGLYVPDPDRWSDPRASPLLAGDLGGLPPALVVTAAADPLRDEGEAYAARLRAAGVPVALHRHPHVHGFLNMTTARSARDGIALMAGALRQALASAV